MKIFDVNHNVKNTVKMQMIIDEVELDNEAITEAIKHKDNIATSYILTKEDRDYIEQFIMEGYRYGYTDGYLKAMNSKQCKKNIGLYNLCL